MHACSPPPALHTSMPPSVLSQQSRTTPRTPTQPSAWLPTIPRGTSCTCTSSCSPSSDLQAGSSKPKITTQISDTLNRSEKTTAQSKSLEYTGPETQVDFQNPRPLCLRQAASVCRQRTTCCPRNGYKHNMTGEYRNALENIINGESNAAWPMACFSPRQTQHTYSIGFISPRRQQHRSTTRS